MSEIKAKLIVCRDDETTTSTCTQNDGCKAVPVLWLDHPGVCLSRSERPPGHVYSVQPKVRTPQVWGVDSSRCNHVMIQLKPSQRQKVLPAILVGAGNSNRAFFEFLGALWVSTTSQLNKLKLMIYKH